MKNLRPAKYTISRPSKVMGNDMAAARRRWGALVNLFNRARELAIKQRNAHGNQARGMVPKQHSSGNRTVLGSISKRGDRYVKILLVRTD